MITRANVILKIDSRTIIILVHHWKEMCWCVLLVAPRVCRTIFSNKLNQWFCRSVQSKLPSIHVFVYKRIWVLRLSRKRRVKNDFRPKLGSWYMLNSMKNPTSSYSFSPIYMITKYHIKAHQNIDTISSNIFFLNIYLT